MSFMDEIDRTLDNTYNRSITENGAIGYRTTGKNLVDMNFAVSSLRNESETEIINRFEKVYLEDSLLAIKWLFYARDIREGLGERRLFKILIKSLGDSRPEVVKDLIKYIPEYGRWDDLLVFFNTYDKNKRYAFMNMACVDEAVSVIKQQFKSDLINMRKEKPISLLAKWLPSENASSPNTVKTAKTIAKKLGLNPTQYRKTLSKMRKYLDVIEVKMSSQEWSEIDYERVPSKANLIYKNAFLRNDNARRTEYLDALDRGEVKINSSVAFPHDIAHRYMRSCYWDVQLNPLDSTLEGMWKALPDLVKGDSSTIVVSDGSGSMLTGVSCDSSTTALEVAISLAIYFAERCHGDFKDKYITFSSRPQLVDFSKAKNLRDKISTALQHSEVSNTNIEAVFDLILRTAIDNNMPQEEIPQNILIISDMEFDSATGKYGYDTTPLFKTLEEKFNKMGYHMPRLVFWNVCGRTGTIPVKENESGVALVSGFSPNIVKMVMSGETDPYKLLVKELMSKRYEKITI